MTLGFQRNVKPQAFLVLRQEVTFPSPHLGPLTLSLLSQLPYQLLLSFHVHFTRNLAQLPCSYPDSFSPAGLPFHTHSATETCFDAIPRLLICKLRGFMPPTYGVRETSVSNKPSLMFEVFTQLMPTTLP